jgi:poly-gamma-glutamate synthesis protein (capsule biosynthesis protein)
MAECGASLILCQHTHCIGCYEKWDNATIVYGQGNFIFDVDDGGELFDSGLLVRYIIGDYGAESVKVIPVVGPNGGAALAGEARANEILKAFEARTRRIRVQGFVEARFREYAAEKKDVLMKVFLGDSPVMRALSALRGGKAMRMYSKKSKTDILDTLLCDSIRELLTEGLYHDVF